MLSTLLVLSTASAQVPIEVPAGPVFTTQERQGGAFGLGVAVGAPTGIHGRFWLGQFSAVQFSFGGDNGKNRSISSSLDYIVRLYDFKQADGEYTIPVYVGGGARFWKCVLRRPKPHLWASSRGGIRCLRQRRSARPLLRSRSSRLRGRGSRLEHRRPNWRPLLLLERDTAMPSGLESIWTYVDPSTMQGLRPGSFWRSWLCWSWLPIRSWGDLGSSLRGRPNSLGSARRVGSAKARVVEASDRGDGCRGGVPSDPHPAVQARTSAVGPEVEAWWRFILAPTSGRGIGAASGGVADFGGWACVSLGD